MRITSDFLVIGSGISGLSFALKVSQYGSVALLSKKDIFEGSTVYAQGGIAAVFTEEDSIKQHLNDTIAASDGLCNKAVAEEIISAGPKYVNKLIDTYGVDFSTTDGEYDLGLEGGHSKRRVLHVEDKTGQAIEKQLVDAARSDSNIEIFENHVAINLFVDRNICIGAYVLDKKEDIIKNFQAKVTILATGGAGKVFLVTSNPDVCTGDGIAMAFRAGARIMNMEFIQFHPTCLYTPRAKGFLITEAMRGEGAILVDKKENRFMEKYHPKMELAPRDVVSRAIDAELKASGEDCVYLDITHKDASFIKNRFPMIYDKCKNYNIDITQDLIPVVPAAHYTIGGVKATTAGKTNIENLLAIGEVACTGFHGANRLASNSLLECLVCGHKAAKYAGKLASENDKQKIQPFPFWDPGNATDPDELVIIKQNWEEIRRFMWNYVGVVRSDNRLLRAGHRLETVLKEINQFYWDFKIHPDLVDLRNLAQVAELIVRCASGRQESRGVHYSIDYPEKANREYNTEVQISMVERVPLNNFHNGILHKQPL
ncbi:L-aspartate oxidase [Candidatus Heimdallarchaeota archaeon]|nr:MAG: L-aspartate oxidase [Candidatus Heimdallarchaeota archaeon]